MADKAERLPWESEPFVNHAIAAEKAITAAQPSRTDTKSAVVVSYARKAFDDETERVAHAALHTRNDTLFKAAANLFELVAAGALTESDVVGALHDACLTNLSIQDDGETQFDKTLAQARRRGFDNPRDLSVVGTRLSFTAGDLTVDPPKTVALQDFQRLERGFWTERQSLQDIYLAALSRMCSPWAVLALCAARALTQVRPHITLPDLIGGPGSLNWFAAIAAKSGGGKGGATNVARELVKGDIRQRNLGSGEGVIDAYMRPADKESGDPGGLYESVMFTADEIDTMATLGQRSGATLSSVLRSGFSGETIGFSYRTASKLHLEAHTYRMSLIIGVQPGRAAALIDDLHTGTLQRFMWFPATDKRVTTETPTMPAPLTLPSPGAWNYETRLQLPYEAIELIKDERARNQRGEQDALDSHSLYAREKFAFALTVLDGRDTMTSDDWRLAGIASRVSNFTRDWVTFELTQAVDDEATEKGRIQGVSLSAANEERTARDQDRLRRIADHVLKKLREQGTPVTHRQLSKMVAHRDRTYLPTVLTMLVEVDRIGKTRDDKWALSKPA